MGPNSKTMSVVGTCGEWRVYYIRDPTRFALRDRYAAHISVETDAEMTSEKASNTTIAPCWWQKFGVRSTVMQAPHEKCGVGA